MTDRKTLAVYAAQRDAYVAMMEREAPNDVCLAPFLEAVAEGGRVLDLGCGPGHFAARMAKAGMRVEAWDAVPEMVEHAARLPGVSARVARFDDLVARDRYDGVWAYFSLLHAPRAAFPGHVAAIGRALRRGGVALLGLKRGEGGGRDRLGRYYEYYERPEIDAALEAAGLSPARHWTGGAPGLAGHPDGWIAVMAHA